MRVLRQHIRQDFLPNSEDAKNDILSRARRIRFRIQSTLQRSKKFLQNGLRRCNFVIASPVFSGRGNLKIVGLLRLRQLADPRNDSAKNNEKFFSSI